jgi:hypothetical protein
MKTMKIDWKKKEKEYVDGGGNRCPYCNSPDITGAGTLQQDSNIAWGDVSCNACHKVWEDRYELKGIGNFPDPELLPAEIEEYSLEQWKDLLKGEIDVLFDDDSMRRQLHFKLEQYTTEQQLKDIYAFLKQAPEQMYCKGSICVNVVADIQACEDICNGDDMKTLRCTGWYVLMQKEKKC